MDEVEKKIKAVRSTTHLKVIDDGNIALTVNQSIFLSEDYPAILDRDAVDWPLLELWTTANCLVNSPEIIALEKYIAQEGEN
ncbi:hypothetical protein Brsp02_01076 [Brucella sp. NBRC 113783]